MKVIPFAIHIAGDDLGVERIGFAALPHTLGIISQVFGIDDINGVPA